MTTANEGVLRFARLLAARVSEQCLQMIPAIVALAVVQARKVADRLAAQEREAQECEA